MLLAALLPGLVQAGQAVDADLPLEAVLAGQSYALENQQHRCALRKPDQSLLMLDIPWPCAFSQNRQGLARVEKFNHNSEIVIVFHAVPKPAPSHQCDTRFHAVRLMKGQLDASEVANSPLCMKGVIDQKNFVAFFHW